MAKTKSIKENNEEVLEEETIAESQKDSEDKKKVRKTVKQSAQKDKPLIIKSKSLAQAETILEKQAEKESTNPKTEKSLEEKKKEILKKAKELAKKVAAETITSEELKEKVKGKKKTAMLIPLDEYVKSGIYLGTKVVTPQMKLFVYRRRADGLAIFNTDLIDEKLKEGIEYLSKFDAKDIILVCKRQAGWKFAEKFSELTGIRTFTKKYPAGVLTNTKLPDFFENELTIIIDSWLDRNALNDTLKVNKKVLMICDTNNFPKGADKIIIGNNKSAKSLGLIFYLLAKEYCKSKKLDILKEIPDLDWWTSEEENKLKEKISLAASSARYGV